MAILAMADPALALRPRGRRALALLALAASLGVLGCSRLPPAVTCGRGEQRAVMDSLYFGTAMPTGAVSVEDWQRFLAEEITPRFPEGLTSWAAAGQWQDGAGHLEKESSYVLHVVHRDEAHYDAAVREVITIYKRRFHQESVLRVRSGACISF